ncbi:hypothetical protein LMG27174_02402 [Paraburkholderia rhynchosiae]|nr:hypothetical protein LMG27174_02402 [Paraburkholderia rhynchosiae]
MLLAANPSAVVCTVFTAPPRENMLTDWDRQSGFDDALQAMQARKKEDIHALQILGAQPAHLPFCDAQYRLTPSHESLVDALEQTLDEHKPETVMIPLGLFHSDHTLVSDACLAVMPGMRRVRFLAYEDVPYRHMEDLVPRRIAELTKRGYMLGVPDDLDTAATCGTAQEERLKREAIAAYASQLRAFGPEGEAALYSPEKYWLLQRFENKLKPGGTSFA